MFEFDDEKLGHVKVMNVTEARASMSKIMADRECNYVILKNNRPIRVIISYETYRKSQKSSRVLTKDSLKGLIEARMSEARKTPVSEESVKANSIELNPLEENSPEAANPMSTEVPVTEEEIPPEGESEPLFEPLSPPPTSDYFARFRKLYEPPRHETPPSEKTERSTPTGQVSEKQTSARQTSDLPSIQDLLIDLENEKLSEGDQELSSDQVNQLLNRLSK